MSVLQVDGILDNTKQLPEPYFYQQKCTVQFYFDQHSVKPCFDNQKPTSLEEMKAGPFYMQLQINFLSSNPAVTLTWLDP